MKTQIPRVVIAGTGSGVGKTTLTIGIMAALVKRGITVQGFKVGPDYIDPTYHTAVTKRESRNLDTWMVDSEIMKEIFIRGSLGADLAIIEGVMGFFDGKDPLSDRGSTAEISRLLNAPVVLVINAEGVARSAAAMVLGFKRMDPRINIAGVVVNQVGGYRHYQLVKKAIEDVTGIPVIGYLIKNQIMSIPERHLGLVPAIERGELNPLFQQLAGSIEEHIDLDQFIQIAKKAKEVIVNHSPMFQSLSERRYPVTIAVAKDEAFHFYYPENLELLEQYGARIQYFSPLAGETIPINADALYIGGGFPEEFAAQLTAQKKVIADFREKISQGMPTFAECGGYMFLTEEIIDHKGNSYEMVGIIPAKVQMQQRLAALGYREITALMQQVLLNKGETARGHEFHYSRLIPTIENYPYAYKVKGLGGEFSDGYHQENLVAGYTHFYFPSNPNMVIHWLEKAVEYQKKKR